MNYDCYLSQLEKKPDNCIVRKELKCPICNRECISSTWTSVVVAYHILNCPDCYFSLKASTQNEVMQAYNCLRKTKVMLDGFIDLVDHLPEPAKLRLLAKWFDYYDRDNDDEVQCDLRRWADTVEEMQEIVT